MAIITSFTIWVIFSLLSGFLEAFFWSGVSRGQIKKTGFEHHILTGFRMLFSVPLIYWVYTSVGVGYSLFLGLSFVLVFSFLHDGMYYYKRNKLDGVYPDGWYDTSLTSTAFYTMDFAARNAIALVGDSIVAVLLMLYYFS